MLGLHHKKNRRHRLRWIYLHRRPHPGLPRRPRAGGVQGDGGGGVRDEHFIQQRELLALQIEVAHAELQYWRAKLKNEAIEHELRCQKARCNESGVKSNDH